MSQLALGIKALLKLVGRKQVEGKRLKDEGCFEFLINEKPNSAVPAAGRTAESPTLLAVGKGKGTP